MKSKIEEIKLFLFLYTSSFSSKLDRGILRFYIRSLSASVLVPTRCTRSSFYRMERIEDDIDTKNHQIISIRNTAQYIIFIQKHFSFFNGLSIIYIEFDSIYKKRKTFSYVLRFLNKVASSYSDVFYCFAPPQLNCLI